jgi:hypothetical protein
VAGRGRRTVPSVKPKRFWTGEVSSRMRRLLRAGEVRGKHLPLLSTTKIRPCVF